MTATCGAAILVRNDARNLAWALRSVRWCDDVVVMDMESTDDTREVAAAGGARVLRTARVREFDRARQALLEACATDWVLLLDSDEVVPRRLADRFQEIVAGDAVDVVDVPFCNYLGEWRIESCGWWPDYHPRLFRKDAARVTGRIHDYLRFDPATRRIRLDAERELSIHHFTYRDVSHFVAKTSEYTYLESLRRHESGIHPSILRMLGAPPREFLRRYVLLGGWREGWRGFCLALLLAVYRLLLEIQTAERWDLLEGRTGAALDRTKEALLG